jgi:hypothetical protein
MANFVYNEFKRAMSVGEIDLDATDSIRIILCMTGTTFDTDYDINTMGGVTTADYFDGANHDTTNGHTLASPAITEVTGVSGYAKFDATDYTFTALGAGSGNVTDLVMFKWITNLSSSMPMAHIDNFTPFNGNGGNVIVEWHTDGILKIGG